MTAATALLRASRLRTHIPAQRACHKAPSDSA
jgi:hypothetical protein